MTYRYTLVHASSPFEVFNFVKINSNPQGLYRDTVPFNSLNNIKFQCIDDTRPMNLFLLRSRYMLMIS